MGIMEPAIKSQKSLEVIAENISKPWYKKIESWLSVVNIVGLIVNIILLLISLSER